MNTLQRKIMRRIYYTYALRTALHPVLVNGVFMFAMLIALTYFVSLGNVLNNFMSIEVGHMGVFLYNAVTNTEAWTLLILGAIILSAFSLRVSISPKRAMSFAKAQ